LAGLVSRLGTSRVRSNACSDTCNWPGPTRKLLHQIEVEDEAGGLWPEVFVAGAAAGSDSAQAPALGPAALKRVLVVHAAFTGVCGLPESLPMRSIADQESGSTSAADAAGERKHGIVRVSRSMLETDRLDEETTQRCGSQFDSIWVPSRFNVRTFSESGVTSGLLKVLPEAIDPSLFNCSGGAPPRRSGNPHSIFGLKALDRFLAEADGDRTFTFLSIFKWEDRKNWRALLEIFFRNFPQSPTLVSMEDGSQLNVTVRLLIKTQQLSWGSDPDDDIAELLGMLGMKLEAWAGRLLIVKDSLPTELVPALYRAADAFVLPTHGEGWGLPLLEALASGLPVIATGWGGQTEFLNNDNSLLLGYQLVSAGITDYAEHKWAEPDEGELKQAMWDALRRTGSSLAKAERACGEVAERFTPDAIARRVDELIEGLESTFYQ